MLIRVSAATWLFWIFEHSLPRTRLPTTEATLVWKEMRQTVQEQAKNAADARATTTTHGTNRALARHPAGEDGYRRGAGGAFRGHLD